MNIDEVIRELAAGGGILPKAAMRSALDDWEASGPGLVALLSRSVDGGDRSEATANALFFAIHLFGEKRETGAFPALCRLLQDAEASEAVLGEAITETLDRVLISTYDGDAGALKRVVESTSADEYARAAAIEAMAYLTRAGALTDEEMRAYLLQLRREMQPQAACYAWTAWTLAVANLGYRDYAGEAQELIRQGFVPHGAMNVSDFDRQLERTLGDPEGMAGLDYDRIRPFTDAIGTLSGWYGFSVQYRRDQERRAAGLDDLPARSCDAPPHVNPLRHVGRNDPCPCGSGKKYKKCCLQ